MHDFSNKNFKNNKNLQVYGMKGPKEIMGVGVGDSVNFPGVDQGSVSFLCRSRQREDQYAQPLKGSYAET